MYVQYLSFTKKDIFVSVKKNCLRKISKTMVNAPPL